MIVLTDERQSLQVAGTQAGENLAGFELQIDLIADEAAQFVDLLAIVGGRPNPAVDVTRGGHGFGSDDGATEQRAEREQGKQPIFHERTPAWSAFRPGPRARSENRRS